MDVLGLLFNAASGGLLGTGMHLITDFMDRKNKIALMEAQAKLTEQTEAWKAFTAAQNSTSPFTVPTNAAPWVSSTYTLVECIKNVTRPLLTWSAVVFLVYVYITATPEVRVTMTPEIQLGSWTAVFFWFGSRYTRK